jgi:hypothetical protein
MVDCIYIAASARDGRFTRICVASVRRFHPDTRIELLVGGPLEAGLAEELARYWNVGLADFPRGDHGWGFVKLEPLFRDRRERFLVLDSDTIFTGDVLAIRCASAADFLVDDESQTEVDTRRLYYDWEKLTPVDSAARPPRFVFNSGQWFGTSGVLTRDDFAPFMLWEMPPRLRHPDFFMPGDQGILNYVFNKKAAQGDIHVSTVPLMRWPGHGMQGLDIKSVLAGKAPALVVHWAGMKKTRLRDMVGSDLLQFFEKEYYKRLPAGKMRRVLAGWRHVLSAWRHAAHTRWHLRLRKLSAAGPSRQTDSHAA